MDKLRRYALVNTIITFPFANSIHYCVTAQLVHEMTAATLYRQSFSERAQLNSAVSTLLPLFLFLFFQFSGSSIIGVPDRYGFSCLACKKARRNRKKQLGPFWKILTMCICTLQACTYIVYMYITSMHIHIVSLFQKVPNSILRFPLSYLCFFLFTFFFFNSRGPAKSAFPIGMDFPL